MTKSKAPSKPMSKAERVAKATKCFKSAGTRLATITTKHADACRDYGIASEQVSQAKKAYDDATRRYESENSRYKEARKRCDTTFRKFDNLHRCKIFDIRFETALTNHIKCKLEFERIQESGALLAAQRNKDDSLNTLNSAEANANKFEKEVADAKHLCIMAQDNLNGWSRELRTVQQPEAQQAEAQQSEAQQSEVSSEVEAIRLVAFNKHTVMSTLKPDSNVYVVNTARDTDHHTYNRLYE